MEDKSCIDVKDKEGNIVGAACAVVSKTPLNNDLIFMLKEGKAVSVRSVTEMANTMAKYGISFEERKKALNFLSERLIYLIR